jgi:hypothetical protein
VLVLDLLKSSTEGASIRDIPIDLLEQIANERNRLAHGHFDQNPFSGDYEIVHKNTRKEYPVERLEALTEQARQAWTALRYAEGFYMFDDVTSSVGGSC